MPYPQDPSSPDADQPVMDETRMRRALGLDRSLTTPAAPSLQQRPAPQRPEQARVRHRFVQDGEVPFEVVNARSAERVDRAPGATRGGDAAALQAELQAERHARAGTERSLAEARAAMQALRTQIAHAELAHAEALAAERRAREEAEATLLAAAGARGPAGRRPRGVASEATTQAPAAEPVPERPRAPKQAREAKAKRRRDPAPKPVRWWLPGYKAEAGGG